MTDEFWDYGLNETQRGIAMAHPPEERESVADKFRSGVWVLLDKTEWWPEPGEKHDALPD